MCWKEQEGNATKQDSPIRESKNHDVTEQSNNILNTWQLKLYHIFEYADIVIGEGKE
jgi:hypothetical protein